MNPCITAGCGKPRLPGRGRRYCADCRAEATERRRLDAIENSRRYRAENPEKVKAADRAYYERTAERQRQRARDWYHANPDRVREQRAKRKAQRYPRVAKYGLTIADYRGLLASQGGACAICGRTENGKRHNLDIDHDHATGEVRGLLCNRCNRLLSNCCEDVEILARAAAYLAGQLLIEGAA